MINITDVESGVRFYAKKINCPADLLPTYIHSNDFGRPHIELDGELLCYVVKERGEELSRKVTFHLDDLLYWIFKDITFQMADLDWRKDVNLEIDPRRPIFAKQAILLNVLNSAWGDRITQFHDMILKEAPFDDFNSAKMNLIARLQIEGESLEKAIEIANLKFGSNDGDKVFSPRST
jgi:hypothetical protein